MGMPALDAVAEPDAGQRGLDLLDIALQQRLVGCRTCGSRLTRRSAGHLLS